MSTRERTTQMKHTAAAVVLVAAVAGLLAVPVRGADPAAAKPQAPQPDSLTILQDRPDAAPAKPGLGAAFESRAAGIALRPPAGCKEIHRGGNPDEIVEFVNDAKSWSLKVTKSTLSKAVPLTEYFDNGRKMPGVLEGTAENFKRDNPTAEIVRQDVIDLGSNKVGMLASRTNVGTQRRLFQQALIQASDTQYYVLLFNSPAAAKGADNQQPDPREKEAVEAFTSVLDTVQLLDRTSIREDQERRLFSSRMFLFNLLTEARIKRALVPEQWFRLIHNGKDIGYTYVVEEPYKQGGNDGVRIGVRSRTVPDKGVQVDAESWLFTSNDRRHETWTNVAAVGDGTRTKDYSSEVGYSDVEVRHTVSKDALPGQKNPEVIPTESQSLTVTRSTKTQNQKPITRPVPPWYVSQAFGHLLPRILPTEVPKTYLFATYVSDQGEIMSRYVDIGRPAPVTLVPGGPAQVAVPVKDRIGLEGSVTTHYVTPEGKYLGSVNEDSKVTILASDKETILRLWNNANLTRPAEPAAGQGSDNGRPANTR